MPKLRPFQREDVEFLKRHGLRALVASAPGTGKTPITVRSIAELSPRSLPALVVSPASVVRNWRREIQTWAPGIDVVVIDDTTTPIRRPSRTTIYVTSWSLLDPRCAEIMQLKLRVVVADEAHFSKNPDALRSRALYDIASTAPGFMLLTGTPIINTQDELKELNKLLGSEDPPMIRRLLEDVAPDIPPKSRSYLYVQLRDNHQAEYDRANRNFEDWLRKEKEKLSGEGMAEYEIERALAAESLVKIGYLRRLAGESKAPAAADWIARAVRLGEPVVVFLEHQAVLEKLVKALKKQRIRHVVIDGSTSLKKRQQAIDDFQANKYPVFIGSKAAKEGITLTAARHLLFVERFYTSAEEEQAEDRIRRIGQKHRTTVWFLHAMGTIDDRVDTIVRRKRVIVRNAIGSADVMETPIGNVASIIKAWDNHATPRRKATSLGRGEQLPPLPRPRETHGIVFLGDRWRPRAAKAWCAMHGYDVSRLTPLNGRFKLVVHPAEVFCKGQFETIRVCRDIRIIVGKRLSRDNERRVRSNLRG